MDCGTAPGVDNGVLDNPSDTSYGDVATYTCDYGYTPEGDQQNRSCLANGEWSESDLICERKCYIYVAFLHEIYLKFVILIRVLMKLIVI